MLDKCYISYLTNDRDIKGILVNNYQLIQHNCEYPYLCLYTKDVSQQCRDILKDSNILTVEVDFHKDLKKFGVHVDKINYLYDSFYYIIFFIFVLSVTKIVFLNANILLLQNIDHLFDKDTSNKNIYMSNDLHMEKIASNNKYTLVNTPNHFNSGVIVCEPNPTIFNQIINYIKTSTLDDIQSWQSDQTVFNHFHNQKFFHINIIHHKYNMIFNSIHFFINNNIIKEEDIHIVHYTLQPKPWSMNAYNKSCREIEKKYWLKWYNTYTSFIEDNMRPSTIELTSISGINY